MSNGNQIAQNASGDGEANAVIAHPDQVDEKPIKEEQEADLNGSSVIFVGDVDMDKSSDSVIYVGTVWNEELKPEEDIKHLCASVSVMQLDAPSRKIYIYSFIICDRHLALRIFIFINHFLLFYHSDLTFSSTPTVPAMQFGFPNLSFGAFDGNGNNYRPFAGMQLNDTAFDSQVQAGAVGFRNGSFGAFDGNGMENTTIPVIDGSRASASNVRNVGQVLVATNTQSEVKTEVKAEVKTELDEQE